MDPISIGASIIAVLQVSIQVFAFLHEIKGAPEECEKCAAEIERLVPLLMQLKSRLGKGDPPKPWCSKIEALGVKDGPFDQLQQALEELRSRVTGATESKLKRIGNMLVWRCRKEEIASILDRIERLKTVVLVALEMDHFKLSEAIKDCGDMILSKTETIQNELEVVKNNTKHTRHEGDLAKHKELTAWISPTNFPADHSDLLGRRQEGTGQWLLEAPKFKQWLSRPNETLFCPGMPGAGKTMLATIAISHLLQTVQNDFTGVAYIYCNYKKQNEQSASSLLAAILKQLVQAYPLLTEPVKRLHALHKERETRPSIVELFDTLQTTLTSLSTVYIVVDALDECRDDVRRSFLAKLRDLQTKIDLRSMVTSRHIPDIVNDLKSSLRLEVRASAGDVAEFVAGYIQQFPSLQRRSTLPPHA